MKFYFTCLLAISLFSTVLKAQNRLSGSIRDAKSRKPLGGVKINIPDLNLAAMSDSLGAYAIKNIPSGAYATEISAVGYATKYEIIVFKGSVQKDYLLELSVNQLKEVVV